MQTRMKFLDKYLTLWIFLAMGLGLLIGNVFPQSIFFMDRLTFGTTNVPLAIGLIVMMYPPLARVNYKMLPLALKDKKVLGLSLVLNWIVGPVLMFFLAVICLKDEPDYMIGLILIGLARCIAMVIVWNDLAKGNREYAALLIALNSVFQVFFYSFYVWFFITYLPPFFGFSEFEIQIEMNAVIQSVLTYLGVPFLAGFLSQKYLVKWRGSDWYNRVFIPFVSPFTLYALLFTIILMFSFKAEQIVQLPLQVVKIAFPLFVYFVLMFFISFFINRSMKVPYDKNAAISFTATGNNFELAIAVSIAVFGIHSPQAFVGVIGPLIEVPVLILLVKISLWLKTFFREP